MRDVSVTATSQDIVVPPIRLAVEKLAPAASRALNALDDAARKTSIEPGLLDLVRLRVSQINGCAYCVDTHSRDAPPLARPSAVSSESRSGARRRSSPPGNVPRWISPRR